MRFWWLCLLAYARGLAWKWPRRPGVPPEYSAVSAALPTLADCRDAYRASGWEPWCFHRDCFGGQMTRLFRVPLADDEKEYRRREDGLWRRQREPRPGCDEPHCDEPADGHCAACGGPRCHRHLYRATQADGAPADLCLDCTEPGVRPGDDWFTP